MKPFHAVRRSVKESLFVFEHGLGDLINFLPVHKEFCRQTSSMVKIAANIKRQFHLINKNIISLTGMESDFNRRFDYIYRVQYPDPSNSAPPIELHNESAKPYLCAYYELGMSDFTWTPYQMENQWEDANSNRVGIHLFGHTGMRRKFCPNGTAETIWREVIDAGYDPFEVHMIPNFANEYKGYDDISCDIDFSFINQNNSLRFEKPDLEKMIKEIGRCKYFIGIDSGPIYLASALIGCDNIIGLTNLKHHNHFIPKHINTVNVVSYKKGSIKRLLKQKEAWL